MRRSQLRSGHDYGMLSKDQIIVPPRQQEVLDMQRPENDVISQYTPEQLLNIAQRRVAWGDESERKRKLTREQQLANDEVSDAFTRQSQAEREANVIGSRRGDNAQMFAIGRTTPLEVASNGQVISPTRSNEEHSANRSGARERNGAPDLDAASKVRRDLPQTVAPKVSLDSKPKPKSKASTKAKAKKAKIPVE